MAHCRAGSYGLTRQRRAPDITPCSLTEAVVEARRSPVIAASNYAPTTAERLQNGGPGAECCGCQAVLQLASVSRTGTGKHPVRRRTSSETAAQRCSRIEANIVE